MNDTAAALGGMGTAVTMNPNSSRKSKKIRKVSHSVLSAATAGYVLQNRLAIFEFDSEF